MTHKQVKKGSLVFIIITVLVDVIGIGIIIPIIPDLIRDLTGITDTSYTAWWVTALIVTTAGLQFFICSSNGRII